MKTNVFLNYQSSHLPEFFGGVAASFMTFELHFGQFLN